MHFKFCWPFISRKRYLISKIKLINYLNCLEMFDVTRAKETRFSKTFQVWPWLLINIYMLKQGRQHRTEVGGPCLPPPPPLPPTLFGIAKRKGKQRRIERFKAETIKKLSPRPKCYYFSHSRTPRIQTFFLVSHSRWPASTFQCSMAPPLWNPFRWPCEISNIPSCSAFEYTNHFEKIQI